MCRFFDVHYSCKLCGSEVYVEQSKPRTFTFVNPVFEPSSTDIRSCPFQNAVDRQQEATMDQDTLAQLEDACNADIELSQSILPYRPPVEELLDSCKHCRETGCTGVMPEEPERGHSYDPTFVAPRHSDCVAS